MKTITTEAHTKEVSQKEKKAQIQHLLGIKAEMSEKLKDLQDEIHLIQDEIDLTYESIDEDEGE